MLDEIFERGEQLGAECAVNDAVIARECHAHLTDEGNAIPSLDRSPFACANGQDR